MSKLLAEQGISQKDTEKMMNSGFYSEQLVSNIIVNDLDGRINRGVKAMTKSTDTVVETLNEATKRILAATNSLTEVEEKGAAASKAAISRVKDMSQQMTDQLIKVNKILGSDFAEKLNQMERFTDALVKLDALNQSGKLEKLMTILGAK